ncbi:MAG: hypothetical protein A2638_03485 [Nitrospirae bacterium RIFCSPHIGHO2_01_FULL_66_17]|nr:MAG: hypothetical protein A2638_03485 [Nitrospirae bacterium RIFCSPHIGHO2_01_FULL_66_17]
MKTVNTFPRLFAGLLFSLYALSANPDGEAARLTGGLENQPVPPAQGSEDPAANGKILVEIFLAPDRRDDLDVIEKAFKAVSITRIRTQFFRLGHPPENVAVGKNVPAAVARLAIHMAITYNGGVKFLLPQYRFFPEHIAIGTSAFDEASNIPIRAEDLDRLSDPALTTSQFHALYRQLTGEDKRLPTYLK